MEGPICLGVMADYYTLARLVRRITCMYVFELGLSKFSMTDRKCGRLVRPTIRRDGAAEISYCLRPRLRPRTH